VEKEKEWGNFLKVENNNMEGGFFKNNNMEGGSVTYKWHGAGGVAMNGGRDGGSGNLGGVNVGKGWTEGSWRHKIHRRMKTTRDPVSRSLVFFRRVVGKNGGIEDANTKWIPLAVTVPNQPAD
jgi:hypothetical protein